MSELERRVERLEQVERLEPVARGLTEDEFVERVGALLEAGRLTYEGGVWGSPEAGKCERLAALFNVAEERRREEVSDGQQSGG